MDKDQFKGKAKQAEGSLEETTGKIIVTKNMEKNGKLKKTAGKVQSKSGDVKSRIKKSKYPIARHGLLPENSET